MFATYPGSGGLQNGQSVFPRSSATWNEVVGGGSVFGTGFLAAGTFIATYITAVCVTPDAGVTHAYYGLYSLDTAGNATLLGQTADTPTIGTVGGVHKVPLTQGVPLTAMNSYAVAVLLVGSSSATFCTTYPASGNLPLTSMQPWFGQVLALGATTLPATSAFNAGNMIVSPVYFEVTTS
jgi:hypothetical protein